MIWLLLAVQTDYKAKGTQMIPFWCVMCVIRLQCTSRRDEILALELRHKFVFSTLNVGWN